MSQMLGIVGGGLAGAAVGTVAETQLTSGTAVEFLIKVDGGQTISVIQTNEDNFRAGERVTISQGSRARLAREGQ